MKWYVIVSIIFLVSCVGDSFIMVGGSLIDDSGNSISHCTVTIYIDGLEKQTRKIASSFDEAIEYIADQGDIKFKFKCPGYSQVYEYVIKNGENPKETVDLGKFVFKK